MYLTLSISLHMPMSYLNGQFLARSSTLPSSLSDPADTRMLPCGFSCLTDAPLWLVNKIPVPKFVRTHGWFKNSASNIHMPRSKLTLLIPWLCDVNMLLSHRHMLLTLCQPGWNKVFPPMFFLIITWWKHEFPHSEIQLTVAGNISICYVSATAEFQNCIL